MKSVTRNAPIARQTTAAGLAQGLQTKATLLAQRWPPTSTHTAHLHGRTCKAWSFMRACVFRSGSGRVKQRQRHVAWQPTYKQRYSQVACIALGALEVHVMQYS